MTDTLNPIPPKKKPQRSQEEIFRKLEEDWDFEKLIEPYREGGTKDQPVRRTWGTVIDWLVNKRKFPPDIVGAAIFLVWMKIKRDGPFKGDGTWGSAGNEFVQTLRVVCASLMQEHMSKKIFSGMAGEIEARWSQKISAGTPPHVPANTSSPGIICQTVASPGEKSTPPVPASLPPPETSTVPPPGTAATSSPMTACSIG